MPQQASKSEAVSGVQHQALAVTTGDAGRDPPAAVALSAACLTLSIRAGFELFKNALAKPANDGDGLAVADS